MVHNGAPNVDAHFNGYFYMYKYTLKFEGNFISFIMGKNIPLFHHFLFHESINFQLYVLYIFPFIPPPTPPPPQDYIQVMSLGISSGTSKTISPSLFSSALSIIISTTFPQFYSQPFI
jgi:hypothetical protein